MNIKQAKAFIEYLYKNGLIFPFEECAVECLYWTGACSLRRAMTIEVLKDDMYGSNLDWGKFKTPTGYASYLINR
jgi:hypothetical protein